MINRRFPFSRALAALAFALSVTGVANATEYVFRDVLGNSPPNARCIAKEQAAERAAEPYAVDRAARLFCEVQGYGWHVAALNQSGTLVCEECKSNTASGQFQCHLQDIAVKCQRIKPGSVGLIPGKS